MTVRLRGHHLLCILTYAGEGYSRRFVEHYDGIIARLETEDVRIVSGPDDICRPLLDEESPHCRLGRVLRRDERALEAVSFVLERPIEVGSHLTLDPAHLSKLRAAFRSADVRAACAGCEWNDLCTAIAGTEFEAARLKPAGRG
jgi:hypothetical protein